jgi:DNA-binding NtrC family response regulator
LSLYLITKEPKLRNRIDHQLKRACHPITTSSQLKNLATIIDDDPHPFILVDDNFYAGGFAHSLPVSCTKAPKLVIVENPTLPFGAQLLSEFGYGTITSPFTIDELIDNIIILGGVEVVAPHLFEEQLKRIATEDEANKHSSVLVGESPQITNVRRIIQTIGPRFSNVHITGETGTGKEIVAKLLYEESRCEGEFVVENCSAITTSLAEAHLFGSIKGAYTDSKSDRTGLIKSADGGVLFLDEIEDMERSIQGKFLRLLETKRFRPVGSDKKVTSEFKLITASNRPFEELLFSETMRFDFVNRINSFVIFMPPLRKRLEDIPFLVDHYLKNRNEMRRPDQETMELIMGHSWPGNVRELFNLLERLVLFASPKAKKLSHRDIIAQSVSN